MAVAMQTILWTLARYEPRPSLSIDGWRNFDGVQLLAGAGGLFQSNILYVGTPDELPATAPSEAVAVFVCINNGREHAAADGLNAVLLEREASVPEVFNELNGLHIHRNTMTYRLRVIKDLTELDLSDTDVAEHLFISIKLMEYLGRFSLDD